MKGLSLASSLGSIRTVELVDVEVVYDGSVRALKVEELVFEPGFHIVMGPNGSGKTTLLDVVAGLVLPSRGKVVLNNLVNIAGLGEDARASIRRDHYSYLLQEDVFIESLSVWDNIAMPFIIHGIAVPEERILELAETLGIRGLLKRKPSKLSGGERRKASIVRALSRAFTASVVLLDEPTSFLDKDSLTRLVEVLESVLRGKIVIIATHDEKLAEIGDRIVRLRGGVVESVTS